MFSKTKNIRLPQGNYERKHGLTKSRRVRVKKITMRETL